MPYTLYQAAKAAGRTKATIQEAIKKGRISAHKNTLGRYEIDPAELHRVYKPVSLPTGRQSGEPDTANPAPAPDHTAEIRRLSDKIDLLERLCSQIEGERDDLRSEREHWRRQLTDQTTPTRPAPRFWFWPWF